MEQAYKEAVEKFPNPERLDKVEESMDNIESVVRERNRAYFEVIYEKCIIFTSYPKIFVWPRVDLLSKGYWQKRNR